MEEGFNKLNKRSLTDLFNFLKWLWADAFISNKKEASVAALTSILQVITQFGALAIIFTYASGIESEKTFNIMNYQFESRTSVVLLIIVSVLGLIIYLTSAISGYISKKTSVSLWKSYEEYCLKRFIILKSRLPHPSCKKANESLNNDSVSKDGRTESRYLGRMFSQILNSIVPIITLLLFISVLFYISYKFTLIILFLSAISLLFLYKVSTQTLQNMGNIKIYSKTYLPEKAKLLDRINKIFTPITKNEFFFENIFLHGEVRKFQDAFFNTYFLREKTNLIVNILTGISIIFIIAISGIGIIYGSFNWAIFLAYIVSLQYFLGSLMQLGNFISLFSRFYPESKIYYEFVTDAENSKNDSGNTCLDDSSIYLKVVDTEKVKKSVELKPGKITFLYNPKGINRNLVSVIDNYTISIDGDLKKYFYWFMQNANYSGMTIRQSHGFSIEYDENTLQRELDEILDKNNAVFFNGLKLDNIISEMDFANLSEKIKSGLQILSAIHSNCKILLLNEHDFKIIMNMTNQSLSKILSNRVIIVVGNRIRTPKVEDSTSVFLISSTNELVSWCEFEWIAKNLQKFEHLLKDASIQSASEVNNLLDLEDESGE